MRNYTHAYIMYMYIAYLRDYFFSYISTYNYKKKIHRDYLQPYSHTHLFKEQKNSTVTCLL